MPDLSLAGIAQWFLAYRYPILIPIMVVEGPIATVIAGFMASQGYFNIYLVFAAAMLGDVIGDLIYYFIGHLGRKRFLRTGRLLGLDQKKMTAIESHYNLHSGKTFFFGKWTQAFGFAILTAAGMASVPLGTFLFFNILGSLPKVIVFEVIGYYFGKNYALINGVFGDISMVIIGISLIAIVLFYFHKKRKNKNNI